jgi:hypothetical protein
MPMGAAPGRAAPIGARISGYWWRLTSTDTSR